MPVTIPNPYSGQDDQTCSVSFQAQQQMAGTVGSPQTEAQYNASKLLGEWGVIKGKIANGQIPNGTKVLAYTNDYAQSRGYLYIKDGKLAGKKYLKGDVAKDFVVNKETTAENLIKSSVYKVSIPQSVSPGAALKGKVLSGQAVHDSVSKGLFKPGTLSPEQEAALTNYETGFYSTINAFLRKGGVVSGGFDKQADKIVKIMDAAMQESPLTAPIQVYRGMYNSTELFGEENFKGDLSGFEWQEKGFASTTTNKAIADSYQIPDDQNHPKFHGTNVQMKVRVAAGVNALQTSTWTQGSAANGPQAEITLDRNMKWKVVKDNGFDANGVRQLEIEVEPKDGGTASIGSTGSAQGTGSKSADKPETTGAGSTQVAAPTPATPVDSGSTSVGSMSHEDVSAMFVKIKDDLAKEKGLNIKGANAALDEEVYKAIGKATGYTPAEVKAKIDAYKAAGNKLSALKKKVLAGTKQVPTGNAHHQPATGPKPLVPTPGPNKPDPKPHGVPTVATPAVANTVKQEVKQEAAANPTKVYSDEDVASAYIIAKDKIVAASNGKWTLYSKNDELDALIYGEVKAKTGFTELQAKQAIANYLASGKKLSQLKKALAKQGAFKPEADTLKKSGAAKTQAEKDAEVAAHADAGYTPTPTPAAGTPPVDTGKPAPARVKREAQKSGDISGIPDSTKSVLYITFKGQGAKSYIDASKQNTYEAVFAVQQDLKKSGKDLTLLQILRVIDEQGSKKFNVSNENLFEKKVASWLTTPEGTAHVKKKEQELAAKAAVEKAAKELEDNQPPLPADSGGFQELSLDEAKALNDEWQRANPWTAKQRRDLTHYTGSAYHAMNKFLRGINSSIDDRSRNAIEGAKGGMRPTTRPLLLKRGTGLEQFQTLGLNRTDTASIWGITGKTFSDGGFLSTSAGGRAAFGGAARLEIECPVGTPMAYVAPISKYPSENEMLLQAGMEYQVLNVRKEGQTFVVRVRVVNWPGKAN